MTRPRVLVVGHITHDRYGSAIVPGGCAFYGASVYSQLGADVHLVTVVGEDFCCDPVLDALPSTVVRRGETTVFTNLYPDSAPRIQVIEAVAPEVRPEGVPDELLRADIVHLAPVLGEVDIAAWKAVARPKIFAVSVQGWIKEAGPEVDSTERGTEQGTGRGAELRAQLGEGAGDVRGRRVVQTPWTVTPAELAGIDVACLSTEDLIDQGDLLDRLCAAIPLVTLTHGRDGCEVIDRTAPSSGARPARTRIGVYPGAEVDFTGAGDTFAAAFLYQRALGASAVEAARFGSAAASIVIEGIGAAALDRLHEARERAAQVPVIG